MTCSSKKFKKQCVIHGMKGKYQYKMPDLSVLSMNEVQKHKDFVIPQKVEGALGRGADRHWKGLGRQ